MNKNCVCFLMGIAAFLLMPLPAYAVCLNPSGVEGDLIYNSDNLVAQYCDDTNWVAVTKRKASSAGDCVPASGPPGPSANYCWSLQPDWPSRWRC